jgi:peroxiredoxin
MMLYYMENTCVCTNNARKFNDQKRLLQKKSAKKFDITIARKMSTGREQQIKTEYTENKILNFFSNNLIIISY